VQAILVNIFAGINRCDWVAQGVVQAARDLRVPLIVRLAGTNVEEGQRIVRESGLPIITADTLAEAAHKAVPPKRARREPPEEPPMSILIDQTTRVIVQGFTGDKAQLPREGDDRLRHECRRRRHPRQGRPAPSRPSRCSTR
jgi:hypothetical protein